MDKLFVVIILDEHNHEYYIFERFDGFRPLAENSRIIEGRHKVYKSYKSAEKAAIRINGYYNNKPNIISGVVSLNDCINWNYEQMYKLIKKQ